MRALLLLLAFGLVCAAPVSDAQAGNTKAIEQASDEQIEQARHFVEKVTSEGISFLADEDLSAEKRQQAFKTLLHKNFDMRGIARFSLGRYWRTATKQQQAEYLKLFRAMIVEIYSQRFSDYEGQNLTIKSARPEGRRDIVVASTVTSEDGPEVRVDWRIRHKKGVYKVIDVIVEGVSMAMTQRSDFSAVIQRGGGKVDVLLAHLRGEDKG